MEQPHRPDMPPPHEPADQPPAVPQGQPQVQPQVRHEAQPPLPPAGTGADILPSAGGSEPFDPEGVRWSRVSPRLIWVRLAGTGIFVAISLAVAVALVVLTDSPIGWLAAVPGAVVGLVAVLLVPRQVRAWGYAEREEDLLVRHGVMFRALTVVPYGRMQYVDVSAGPVDRALGLATVRLHTASASTDAAVPGLTKDAAARLRDRLTQAGQAQLAGL